MSVLLFLLFLILATKTIPIYGNFNCNEEGSVRLVDGTIETEGRVEVCHNGAFGTVCDEDFWIADARVVCKQLGFPNDVVEVLGSAYFGEGSGTVALSEVDCVGTEDSIFGCKGELNVAGNQCDPSTSVGIICLNQSTVECDEGSVRLVNGQNIMEGRIEVCYNGEWGTVCDDSFDMIDGTVLCRQLGFTDVVEISKFFVFGAGEGNIWIDRAQCTGDENSIFDCISDLGSAKSRCSHFEDVGISCSYIPVIEQSIASSVSSTVETSLAVTTSQSIANTLLIVVSSSNIISLSPPSTIIPTLIPTQSSPNPAVSLQTSTAQITLQISTSPFQISSTVEIVETNNSIIILVGSATSVLILIIMIIIVSFVTVLCILRSKSRKKQSIRNPLQLPSRLSSVHRQESIVRYIELGDRRRRSSFLMSCLINSSDLKLIEKIGQGEFGVVYRGVLTKSQKDGIALLSVAVKTLKGDYHETEIQQLLQEAEKMKQFEHLNVLTLIGVSLGVQESPCIVMPFMSNGSLLSYLRKEAADLTISELADETIVLDTTKQLLSMCLQVAKGMEYLTEHNFIHRDLAARNCMISSDGVIKVADFGLAEEIYTTEYFKQSKDSDEPVKLPIKWMALESIHFGKFSGKSDVWSYGILCWEIFTLGRSPYPGIDPRGLVHMLDNGERLDRPSNPACTEEMYSLMLSCWYRSPDERPSFSDVVSRIETMMAPLADYMDFTKGFSLI